jgi:hypothetical protein
MTPAVSLATIAAIVWLGAVTQHPISLHRATASNVAVADKPKPRTRPRSEITRRVPLNELATTSAASPVPAPASLSADSAPSLNVAIEMRTMESAVTGQADRRDAEDAVAKQGSAAIAFFPGGSMPSQ